MNLVVVGGSPHQQPFHVGAPTRKFAALASPEEKQETHIGLEATSIVFVVVADVAESITIDL